MNSYNVLYTAEQIQEKVLSCAEWIDSTIKVDPTIVICPILQSSFYFASDVFRVLNSQPKIDFCGITRYDEDNIVEDFYMYKGVDLHLYDGRNVILLDTLCNTGATVNCITRFLTQFGAKRVYTAILFRRQFAKLKPDWVGFTLSDESVAGYGLDVNSDYRTIPYLISL